MRELSVNEVQQVNGGIYGDANPYILGYGLLMVAAVATGGGALAVAGAALGMIQSGAAAGAFSDYNDAR